LYHGDNSNGASNSHIEERVKSHQPNKIKDAEVLSMVEENKDTEEVWSQFKDFQHVFLATMEGDQPRVRPVTLINFDEKFWVTTDTWSEKIKQIQKNPRVEFSFVFKKGDKDCCIRVTGLAKIIKDKLVKAKLAGHCSFFSEHWESVDDPSYTLLEIFPSEATYVAPDKATHVKL
jgi:general stress protein 26